jgi:hypothetical protein
MRTTGLATVLALVVACAGANTFRLDDAAAMHSDDLRWGRLPAAEMSVSDALRPRFVREHAAWGRAVHIVDVELENTRSSGLTGIARTRYVWTRANDIDTRETVVETHWRGRLDGGWICDDERVVWGDPALLATR